MKESKFKAFCTANILKINEEKSLSLIASNKSIIFDAGQAFVAQFFDNLLIKFGKFQTENFISKIFIKNNTKEIKGLIFMVVLVEVNQ